MALINCPECNKEISSSSQVCPNCGAKKPKESNASVWVIILVVIGILALIGSTLPESQYEKDSKSWQNKTYDEMSGGEKDAMKDFIDWKLKQDD